MGGVLGTSGGIFDLDILYGDGFNLYQFAGSNPITSRDPLGLSADFDYFAEGDELIADIIGNRVATLAAAKDAAFQSFNSALLLGQLAVSMLPGGDAVILMGKLALGKDIGWQDVVGAGLSLGGAVVVGKLIGNFVKSRRAYKAGTQATTHGAQRLAQFGFTDDLVRLTKTEGQVLRQADGATVYLRQSSPGRFDFIVEGERGVITAHRNMPQKAIDGLAQRYGWSQ
jgi:hypothetical protein